MNEEIYPILSQHGIDRMEFYVLHVIYLRKSMIGIDKLAPCVHWFCVAEQYPLEDYEHFIQKCLNKQWIKVLTLQDCIEDQLRWEGADDQCCGEYEYQVGNVDFTPEGASLYYAIHRDIDVLEGRKPYGGRMHYSWKVPGRLRVYAVYQEELKAKIEEILTGRDTPFTHGEQISRIDEPHLIHGWWLTRYVQIPEAYYTDIYYLKPDRGDSLE